MVKVCLSLTLCVCFFTQTTAAFAQSDRRPATMALAFFKAIHAWPEDFQDFYAPIAAATEAGEGVVTSFSIGPSAKEWQIITILGNAPDRGADPWLGHYTLAGSYGETDWYELGCARLGQNSIPLFDRGIEADKAMYSGPPQTTKMPANDVFRSLTGAQTFEFLWLTEERDVEIATRCTFQTSFAEMTAQEAMQDFATGLKEALGAEAVSVKQDEMAISIDIAHDALNSDRTKFQSLEVFVDTTLGMNMLNVTAEAYRTKGP